MTRAFQTKVFANRFCVPLKVTFLLIVTTFFYLTGCTTRIHIHTNPNIKAINTAAKEGNAEKAASLVASVPPKAAARALSEAAKLGNLNVVEAMVAQGADINGGHHEELPTERPMNDIINWIFNYNEFHDIVDDNIPLISAARAGRLEVVKWLVEHGANLNLRERAFTVADLQWVNGMAVFRLVEVNTGNNALSAAILGEQSAIVQFLVAHGADLSYRVVFSSAKIRGLIGYRPTRMDKNGLIEGFIINDDGKHFYMYADGFIHTDLAVCKSQEASIRELMAQSTNPEIRSLSTQATANQK